MADQTYTGVMVALLPASDDPIVAASSEPAHLTLAFLGEGEGLSEEDVRAAILEVEAYATDLDGPLVMNVETLGELGDEGAEVAFLERTDSAVALRQGLIDGAATVRRLAEANDRFLADWKPHVTLGYPDSPPAGEYDAQQVTFDRIGVWVGDEHHDYDMGGDVSRKIEAAATPAVDEEIEDDVELDQDEMPVDELEDDEELIDEIPVHGVATVEGRPTGDGRGFRANSLEFDDLPQPLGYEFEHGHGSDNSRVAIIGRVDSYERKEIEEGVFEIRWTGVIFPDKEYASRAIESIIDGSYTGVSVIVDSVTLDVEEQRERFRQQIRADRERMAAGDSVEDDAPDAPKPGMTDEEIDEMVDAFIGDGTQETTWYMHARVRRFDMVPTGAFIEGYTALGHEFVEDMTPEQIEASLSALEDCGCLPGLVAAAAPQGARDEAQRGLDWVAEGKGGDGLEDATLDRARKIAAGEDLTDEHISRMHSFFARHEVDKQGQGWSPDQEGYPSAGRVAWALWGGDAGKAFADAEFEKIDSGESVEASGFAPGTKDGPGWITHPTATARIRRYWVRGEGAAKIRWGVPGDFNRCRRQLAKYVQNPEWLAGLCANMHKEAIGVWPGQGHSVRAGLTASAAPAPLFSLVAAPAPVDASYFKAPTMAEPAGIVIEGDRIFGYIAVWNVCHIGEPEGPNTCTLAPRSATGYSFYRTGTVQTTEGPISVGSITMGTGHAGDRASAMAAVSHYDNTGTVVADVVCGEDSTGIWYSGRVRPGVTDEQRYELLASGRLSGDWRRIGGNFELVAALVVNVPGFPIPTASLVASASGVTAIIGEGMVEPGLVASAAPTPLPVEMTAETVAGIAIAAVEQYIFSQQRAQILEEVQPAREALELHQRQAARRALATLTKG